MSLLRSIVFATRTDEVAMEINQGRLSGYLLKPVHFFVYTFSRDLAEKSINSISSLIEIAGLYLFFHVALAWPTHLRTWFFFAMASALALVMNYLINFAIGCWGFWTSESSGPRFLVALILEFTAGAFFPLDILPVRVQHILHWFPSPYLIFFPINVLLEKSNLHSIINGFASQIIWIFILGAAARLVWLKGVKNYGAEGA
jgi:ABC-2 type transport system permease protein